MVNFQDPMVNQDNYCQIRAWIDDRARHYRINVEQWIVAQFLELPKSPNGDAVQGLEKWIRTYLSKRMLQEMWIDLMGIPK